ncbi:BlyA family holin [Borrelia miyamotoi]|uniref:BlyA family holin n=1 Tax=Borrelia miyamotoi TaxID=47466 RepID=A0AAQ2WWF9_9SPIR|nr:BlyA family holin [Borrelia miyamotoi]QTL83993.1 BlyA family holin [Borrelia miyamotoi]QTL84021.1 BlyA family holin [Borrelia miyamotoi]QTL84326.1 BlyA family holin [Borrelia miyamotoi]WAZ85628.1 BlyA family holin [Borrelia miyamotoi]WAZ85661.1 BlyA family holin [Borrelia miyamotoi]
MNDTNNLIQLLLGIDSNKLLVIAGLILGIGFLLKPVLKDIISIIIDKLKNNKDKNNQGGTTCD